MSQPTKSLAQRGWRPEVYEAVCDMLADADSGEFAVFDFDNTCILGDIGESFHQLLIEEMVYRYDLEAFWELIADADGGERLREITDELWEMSGEARRSSPVYEQYLGEMSTLYARRLERSGKRDCYEWVVRLCVGLDVEEMNHWSREAIRRALSAPLKTQRFEADDGFSVDIKRGVRPLAEIRELIAALQAADISVWIVSATNIWTVRACASLFGVPKTQVLGNRVQVCDGTLTAQTVKPVLYRQGKAEAVEESIGDIPVLAVGDAVTDFEMLKMARRLSLVIDCGDQFLRRQARERRWALQPQRELEIGTTECTENRQ